MSRIKACNIFLLTVLFFCMVLLSCTASHQRAPVQSADRKGAPHVRALTLEKQIHILINKERRKEGLPLLEWSAKLAEIAHGHSRDMAKRNYFDHTSPDGHDYLQRYKQAGYSCGVRMGRTTYLGAENIAQNNLYDSVTTVNGKSYYDWNSEGKIADTTVRGWMNSSGHRKNILTPYFKSEGIGVFISPDDKVYVTQNFC